MSSEEGGETRRVAAGHSAFGGDAIDTGMAAGDGEAGGVARCVVVVDEAEIELAAAADKRRKWAPPSAWGASSPLRGSAQRPACANGYRAAGKDFSA